MRDYLEALRSSKPKRGRKRTPDAIKNRLAAIDDALTDAGPMDELLLTQERRDLLAELANMSVGHIDVTELENGFVRVAQSYGERKGIEYSTWREVGVPAAVLKRAGIGR